MLFVLRKGTVQMQIVVHQSITAKVAVSHNIALAVSIMFQNYG